MIHLFHSRNHCPQHKSMLFYFYRIKQAPASIAKSNNQQVGTYLYQEWYNPTPDKLRSSIRFMSKQRSGLRMSALTVLSR